MATKEQLKEWFKKGKRPTQEQFWNTWDSFWHKNEKIKSENIEGLNNALAGKVDSNDFAKHQSDPDTHEDIRDAIGKEGKNRTAADNALLDAIKQEVATRQTNEDNLQKAIGDEVVARAGADSALQSSIDTEIRSRTSADNDLKTSADKKIEILRWSKEGYKFVANKSTGSEDIPLVGLMKGIRHSRENGELKLFFEMCNDNEIVVNLGKDMVIKSGAYNPQTQNIELTTVDGSVILIPAGDLIDVYTGANTSSIKVYVSDDNVITAEIVFGGNGSAKTASRSDHNHNDTYEPKDTSLQSQKHTHTNKTILDKVTGAMVAGKLKTVKKSLSEFHSATITESCYIKITDSNDTTTTVINAQLLAKISAECVVSVRTMGAIAISGAVSGESAYAANAGGYYELSIYRDSDGESTVTVYEKPLKAIV